MPEMTEPNPLGRFADRVVGRLTRLGHSDGDYRVERGLRIPMRDGIELVADRYLPDGEPKGLVLVRCLYGREFPYSLFNGRLWARHGYQVLLQSTRGTFGSEGDFEPMANEARDGADTVAWLRGQPWFPGRFATFGISYLGYVQWALLSDPPPEMVAAVLQAAPHDLGDAMRGKGAFKLADGLGWADLITHQELGRVAQVRNLLTAERRLAGPYHELPMREVGERLVGEAAPWYLDWLERGIDDDAYWDARRESEALERADIPILLQTGWQDIFLHQTLTHYRKLRDRRVDVSLTIGPWTHVDVMAAGLSTVMPEALAFLDRHLAGESGPQRDSPVRLNVTGVGEWRNVVDWPIPSTDHVLHLSFVGSSGALTTEVPAAGSAPASFTYDPADPTPTVGGRLLSPQTSGRKRDDSLAERDDVLVYDTSPLPAPVEVIGEPRVELVHTSDSPFVDLFVRISEVDRKGKSRNVSDGFERLEPTTRATRQDGEVVSIPLDAMAHRFAAGSRIRLLVAGGSHPRFARNLGTGADDGTETRPSHRTIAHDGRSRLVLPLVVTPSSP